jgi:protein kinase C substrate 80K-H
VFAVSGASHDYAVRGVSDRLLKHYVGDVFVCLDRSNDIPASFVNDDFCDCADGSDEPGTSACEYVFHCADSTFGDVQISTSKLGDGVCDCCDGSDEAEAVCPNTCSALTAPMTLLERAKMHQEGMRKKLANSQAAKLKLDKMKRDLSNLKRRVDSE